MHVQNFMQQNKHRLQKFNKFFYRVSYLCIIFYLYLKVSRSVVILTKNKCYEPIITTFIITNIFHGYKLRFVT